MTDNTFIQPASVPTMATIIEAASARLEKRHGKALAALRAKCEGWHARQAASDLNLVDRRMGELLDKWERSEVPADAILSAVVDREFILSANRRCETYGDFLDREAAPFVSEVVGDIAETVARDVIPLTVRLDEQAAAFGTPGTVAVRMAETVARLRAESEKFKTKSVLALARLGDFVDGLD